MLENKIMSRVSARYDKLTIDEFCKWNDIEITEDKSFSDTYPELAEASKKIFRDFMRFNDLLSFLTRAFKLDERFIKYRLSPPYTTSKLDCDYILNILLKHKVLNDISYSLSSGSFFIELNLDTDISLNDILNIGLCANLADCLDKDADIKYSVRFRVSGDEDAASAAVLNKNKLLLFHIVNAAGLESDIPSHNDQIARLRKRIFKARKLFCDTEDIFIVTPFVASLLPAAKNVIPINNPLPPIE